ncbi:MAG: hypothetical protein M3Q34_03650 [bacterium]|nr:hypothetical protein [bacterium]
MIDTLLLNKEFFKFKAESLPCLIHYGEKMGGSHLSIVLIAELFSQGYKIVFMCGHPMGEEKFMEQIDKDYTNIKFVANREDFPGAEDYQMVIIKDGNESLLYDASVIVPDFNERIIFIKNIEKFGEVTFDLVLPLENVILSGNVDECMAKWKITQKVWDTMIAFNQPEVIIPGLQTTTLDPWTAHFKSPQDQGVISVLKDKIT